MKTMLNLNAGAVEKDSELCAGHAVLSKRVSGTARARGRRLWRPSGSHRSHAGMLSTGQFMTICDVASILQRNTEIGS